MARPGWAKTLVIAIRARQPKYYPNMPEALKRTYRGDRLIRLLCLLFGHERVYYLNQPGIPQFCIYCRKALGASDG